MVDEPHKPGAGAGGAPAPSEEAEPANELRGGVLSELVRRAFSAGVGAARTSKEEVVRAAANEMRGWLDHLDLEKDLVKALSRMVIEVKTEIRFHPAEDGTLVPEAKNAVKIGPGKA